MILDNPWTGRKLGYCTFAWRFFVTLISFIYSYDDSVSNKLPSILRLDYMSFQHLILHPIELSLSYLHFEALFSSLSRGEHFNDLKLPKFHQVLSQERQSGPMKSPYILTCNWTTVDASEIKEITTLDRRSLPGMLLNIVGLNSVER